MRKQRYNPVALLIVCLAGAFLFSGCGTVGNAAADLSLAGAGGAAGYQVSGQKIGGAAAGAAVGYVASKVAQSKVEQAQQEAEQRGYDRAMNQAVKQQYWIIQNQQRSRETPPEAEGRLMPVVIPETKINGVVQSAHIEYLLIQP